MTRLTLNASFLAIGCALLIGGYSTAAHAASEPEIHFYPAKKWNTLSTEATLAGATVQNCSITNEFNNGFIVQISGSHKWVEAMQIDFRQDAFSVGESYDVKLTVPGLKNKTLSGAAANSRQLVLNLKGQKDMYQAMRDSSVFDLKIDENEFRFYMVGFAESAKAFERCMAGGDIKAPEPMAVKDVATDMPTFNEAIAYEQAEKSGVPIQEIIPPVKAPEIESSTVEKVEEEKAPLADAPLAVQVAKQTDTPRKRLSDQLAEEINRNPDIASPETSKPLKVSALEQVSDEKTIAEIEETAPSKKVETKTKEPIVIPPAEPTEKPLVNEEPIAVVENLKTDTASLENQKPQQKTINGVAVADPSQARSGLVLPPDFKKRPVMPAATAEKTVSEEDSADVTAELEEFISEAKTKELAPKEDVIAVKEVETAPSVPVQDNAAVASLSETENEKEIFTPDPPQSSHKADDTKTETVGSLLDEADTTKATTPASKAPEPARMKVNKQVGSIEADFTDDYERSEKMKELELKLDALEKENAALNADLKLALQDSKQEVASIANGNWNLEKATRQFNEAERQLKRLGQQLQQERRACDAEKAELEAMLFDPTLTEDAQLAKLTRLQRELDEAKDQLRALQRQ